MSDVGEIIIQKIRRNRISTSEISDCLGKTGVIHGLNALNTGHFRVGPVRFVYAWGKSNWELHEQVQHVRPGEIVVCHAIDCGDFALFGALVAKFVMLYREAAAILVSGFVRDVHTLRMENYPIWCKGTTPLGCYNKPNEAEPDGDQLSKLKNQYEGSIAICDDSGVVIIPQTRINEAMVGELDFIELQEDAWFHSIDTDGLTTFETVCQKRYLEQGSTFSAYELLKRQTLSK